MRAASILNSLPAYRAKQKILVQDQSTSDIINAIINAHYLYAEDYKKIAKYFEGANDLETAKNVFKFLKKNVRYVVDSEANQKIKSPSAIINTGACDCKCYSLFIGGILGAMKIPFVYRFASYNKNKSLGHVFIVMYYYAKEIYIDPVLDSFNDQKKYTHKIDKMITSISGIGKPAKKAAKKAVLVKSNAPKAKQPFKKVLVKVAAVPARNAFLLLVKLNFQGLAVKLSNSLINNAAGVEKIWTSVGGKFDSLKKAIEQGSRKAPVENIADDQAIGAVTAAAAIAAAAPIILKVTSFLKSAGIDTAKIKQVASKELVKSVNKAKDKIKQAAVKKLQPKDKNNVKLAVNPDVEAPQNNNEEPPIFDESKSVTLDEVVVKSSKKNNTFLYAAAALAAVFLISRK
jgi:hypothetical protein